MKFLLVEDNEVDHFITNQAIKDFFGDVRIKWAMNGSEALEILNKQPDFDAIFLDINMPVMNGLEFLEQYSKSFKDHTLVFPLSSSSDINDIKTSESYEFVPKYLVKPIGMNALKNLEKSLKAK